MAIFKALTFDGVNSLDYGIYITGEAVYNAPERAVEMVNIPGKNGALALDQGRFENIEVTYHAGCFADNQADFADKVMKFRNALASRYTYKRLTDEYHPDEYRLGLYKSGLDVDAVRYGTAGEFNIVFDCKPQRFLVDGDREILPTEWSDVQTATGELVTIDSDGSLAVKALEVSLSPIQDLNGYDKPWVGGAGKNKLPPYATTQTKNGITFTVNSDGTIKANGTATATTVLYLSAFEDLWSSGSYILNGCPSGGGNNKYCLRMYATGGITLVSDYGSGVTFTGQSQLECAIVIWKGQTVSNIVFEPMIRLASETDATYAPYENICPISGRTEVTAHVSPTTTGGTTYTTALGRTVYGGTLDVVSGVLTVDRGYIASYNGETLPSTWISDRDEYASGTTPTIGAEVVYELATPQTYQLTPQQIDLLLGTNHLWSEGEITVTYGVRPYYNPTPFESKPLIKVTGTGTLGIGEYILTITGTASQTLYIDCETMEIYTIEGTVPTGASSLVSINKNDFPVLEPGTNYISVGSGITDVTITPRWWRI